MVDDGDLTWGEWQDVELPFEESLPQAQDTIADRAAAAPRPGEQADIFDYSVGLYQIPTATSDPSRPRTVAAKYEPSEKAVYVVMRPYHTRDGNLKTPVVKYFPLTITDWRNFRSAYSKGRYILRNWESGGVQWEELSDTGGFDQFLLTAADYAASQQRVRDGLQAGQSPGSDIYRKLRKAVAEGRRVSDVRLRSDRLGGTGRKRMQKTALDDAVASFYRNKRPT